MNCQKNPQLSKDNSAVIEILKKIDRFKPLPDKDLLSLLQLGKLRDHNSGEIIIKQGDYDCWIFILLNGSVKIFKDDRLIGSLNRNGDIFGEMGIIDGSPRSASIVAGDGPGCHVLGIDGSILDRCLAENNVAFCYTIYRIFAEILAARLRDTTNENVKLRNDIKWLRRTV